MPLELDLRTALRGTNDLHRLVEAIAAATEHDETDWVEWKSTLDLTTKEGCFHVARAVLGMSNRIPDRAALTCEGLGYVVVGAQPGQILGVASVDPAVLDQFTQPYLGGPDGPRSSPTYVQVDGKTVLVVTVEAPRPGDRIFPLRKELDKYTNGMVFVRKHGRTVIADAADLDALQGRLTAAIASGAELEVGVVGDVPLSWIDGSGVSDVVGAWAAQQRNAPMERARTVARQRNPKRFTTESDLLGTSGLRGAVDFAQQQRAMMSTIRSGLGIEEEDTRTYDEYVAQVDTWTENLAKAARSGLARRFIDKGHGAINVQVFNAGSRFLPDVEVQVHFDVDTALSFDTRPSAVDLPRPPRDFGKPKPSALNLRYVAHAPATPDLSALRDVAGRRTWIDKGSIVVRFGLGDLRQHDTDRSDPVYVVLRERPSDGVLHGSWKATVRDVEGLLTGTIDVPVATEPVDVAALLAASPRKKT